MALAKILTDGTETGATAADKINVAMVEVDASTVAIPKINISGDGASYPTSPSLGQKYFDTDLGQPMWWNGSIWGSATEVLGYLQYDNTTYQKIISRIAMRVIGELEIEGYNPTIILHPVDSVIAGASHGGDIRFAKEGNLGIFGQILYDLIDDTMNFNLVDSTTGIVNPTIDAFMKLHRDGTATIGNGLVQDKVATLTDIRDFSTIVIQTLADQKKPTRAEAILAFKTLPHHDWALNDTFYIRDSSGGNKMVFCTYIADGATDEANAGDYFFKDMNECI